MERFGIQTGADLKAKSLAFLTEHFGKSGGWYYRISRGIDNRPVQPNRERKSIGTEDTFATDIYDLNKARTELAPLIKKVWQSCEAKRLYGRTVTLKIKYADFQRITRSKTVVAPLHSVHGVERIAYELLFAQFPTETGIRLIGVTVSSFQSDCDKDFGQLSLQI